MTESDLQLTADPYSYEIISKACELSPELDDYIVSHAYLNEIHDDDVTSLWLRNKLITMLVEQLEDRGVRIEMDRDDICDNPRLVQTVLYLRSKFDTDRLYDYLTDHADALKTIQGLTADGDDLVESIARAMNGLSPLDEGWECIVTTMDMLPGIVTSTKDFSDLIDRVLDKVDRLGDQDAITINGDLDGVLDYVKFLNDRKNKILKLAAVMYSGGSTETQETAQASVEGFMRSFEVELARPNVVEKVGDKEITSQLINDTRKSCAEKWRHTLEHWISGKYKDQTPTLLDMAVLVATLYVDSGSPSSARVKIIETFEGCADLLGDRYEMMRNLLDDALANLVVFQEQGGGVSIVK